MLKAIKDGPIREGDEVRVTCGARHNEIGVVVASGSFGLKRVRFEDGAIEPMMAHQIEKAE